MPFQGFEGPAGTGKTHHLIEALTAWIGQNPLQPHQQVLALTFMHGSRRRLDQRLSSIAALRGRYSCQTIDSLAEQLVSRWKSLCVHFGLQPEGFERTVECAARLLEEPVVVRWLAATFPVVVVDEAQDLTPARLRLVSALPEHVRLFIAADEFQCLTEELDAGPFRDWFATGQITQLQEVRRTNQRGLLDGAMNLRAGRVPANGPGLNIRHEFNNNAPFVIGRELHRCLRAGGEVALIVAPSGRPWADQMLPRFIAGLRSRRQTVAPLRIAWEARAEDEVERVMADIPEEDALAWNRILGLLEAIENPPPWLPNVVSAINHQRRACGQVAWTKQSLRNLVDRRSAAHRAYGYGKGTGIPVMSIHGAKNRQFRHVVVLWPPGVPGAEEQLRRLLYNAITRAQQSCTVFVRTQNLLDGPPFA